ncbi:hypothetical protein [Nocardioides aurantiacus]|uniref:Uncharacterized protein n=1 Tax=Nocardioides aurantiacus TaxID=86796 RepID=A0A3N2CXG3_9ACTN|nr:hypothetical protein [Nocardioides aurantiacus]ROR92230.1 hypothetical protein EDD33_3116 [Nocardioides aurantiacus]
MIDRILAAAGRVLGSWAPDLGHDLPEPSGAARLRRFGVPLVLLAVLVQSAVHLVNLVVFDLGIDLLNLDIDGGVFSWASVVVTFAVAFQLLVLAAQATRRAALLVAVAGAVAFLSLDDSVQLHERVSEWKTQLGPIAHFSRTFWPLVYLPLLAFVLLVLLALATRMRRAEGRLVVAALLGLGAAVLLEMASPALFALGFDHGQIGYEWEAVVEEGLELGGWALIALALAAASLVARSGPASPSPGRADRPDQQGQPTS